jgi:hypothetical protein
VPCGKQKTPAATPFWRKYQWVSDGSINTEAVVAPAPQLIELWLMELFIFNDVAVESLLTVASRTPRCFDDILVVSKIAPLTASTTARTLFR